MQEREKKRKAKAIQKANEMQNLAIRAQKEGRFVPSEIKIANTTVTVSNPKKLKKKLLKAIEKEKTTKEDLLNAFEKAR